MFSGFPFPVQTRYIALGRAVLEQRFGKILAIVKGRVTGGGEALGSSEEDEKARSGHAENHRLSRLRTVWRLA